MGTSSAYELHAATRCYGDRATLVVALDAIDLSIRRGEFLAILGPSGSGKTTLLQLLGALDRPSDGSVAFEGQVRRSSGSVTRGSPSCDCARWDSCSSSST